MEGPSSFHRALTIAETGEKDVVWLIGLSVDLFDETLSNPVWKEFFCHSNLTLNGDMGGLGSDNESFSNPTHSDWRLFTLVPGKWEIRLPDGFGVPIRSDMAVDNFTMALNQNPKSVPREIRMKSTLHYERGTHRPMESLFQRGVTVYQQHQETEEPEICEVPTQTHEGEACAISQPDDQLGDTPSLFARLGLAGQGDLAPHPGETCCVVDASEGGVLQQFGQDHTIHWMVPLGRHVYRSEITKQLKLPATTTAHYITGHVHPTGEWVKLVNLTTGETVVTIESKDFDDRWGVKRMTEYVSEEGILIHEDHRYELVTQYMNPTDKPVDVMAILYLYLLEPGDAAHSELALK